MTVRTRMAPSPTGEFHIGGLRTFLYNYAFAKKNNGKMILRIEDTDKEREVEGASERIMKVIRDYGLDWDEGPDKGGPFGPYLQSKRLKEYREYASKLVDDGKAYHCFCSPERLQKLREEQTAHKSAPRYDKHCYGLSTEEIKERLDEGMPYVLRLNVPSDTEVSWEDGILGTIRFNSNDIDDQVLIKSDGFPTYHLAVVVDDHLMEITHVMRGMEWLPSTPKHLLLYTFLGWNPPVFSHLPNLKEKGSNQKLSKRFGDVHARAFLENGYLPEAVLNFLMFLGWNPGTEKEIYSLDEFIGDFLPGRIHQTDLVAFDREKLLWYNGVYIRKLEVEKLWQKLKDWSVSSGVGLNVNGAGEEEVLKVLTLVQERMKTLTEFNDLTDYFFNDEIAIDDKVLKSYGGEKTKDILRDFFNEYQMVDESKWASRSLEKTSLGILEKKGYNTKEAFMSLRVAVTGKTATPPLFDTMEILGKKKVLRRIQALF